MTLPPETVPARALEFGRDDQEARWGLSQNQLIF